MSYTFELETMVIGRHMLGVHETCVHETFGTIRSIFTTSPFLLKIRFTVYTGYRIYVA